MAVRFRASMSAYASLSVQFARAQLHELFETVGEDGLPSTSTIPFGFSSVSGRRRVPSPAANTTAFMGGSQRALSKRYGDCCTLDASADSDEGTTMAENRMQGGASRWIAVD